MFIDGELDADETNDLHEAFLKNPELRERACQLKAVRELVAFAYQTAPEVNAVHSEHHTKRISPWKCLAACMLLCIGVVIGWSTHQYGLGISDESVTANSVFNYYAARQPVKNSERKFILHLSSSDFGAVKAALDEADNLIASYKRTKTPLKIDIIANQQGIDVLRTDVSPYLDRIEKMVSENHDVVSLFACARSLNKARLKEGHAIEMLPGTRVDKTARELIPERLNEGWVYIKV
jgi:intracellular sulfur oxidation DsrE/DsrF family protein